jgi:hypothetical protein
MASGHATAMDRAIFDVNCRTEPFESAMLLKRCGWAMMAGILVRIICLASTLHTVMLIDGYDIQESSKATWLEIITM